jgi:hypothetical protein
MARASLEPDAAHLFAGVVAANTRLIKGRIAAGNSRLTKRRVAAGLPATAGPVRTVSAGWWLKLVRRGPLVTTFESPDGAVWTPISSETLSLPDTFFLGLAFAAGPGTNAQGAFDQVSVRALAANKPPVVAIETPTASVELMAGATVALSASASDPDDRVDVVEFYVDGTRIGADTATPYQATWAGALEGTRVLTAVAIDSEGAHTTSAPVTVNISTPLASAPSAGIVPSAIPPVIPEVVQPLLGRMHLQFAPSTDHDRTVDRYVLEVFKADLLSLVSTLDLGRPAVSGGLCTVEVSDLIGQLAVGSYVFSLRAVDDGTGLSSAAATTTYTR